MQEKLNPNFNYTHTSLNTINYNFILIAIKVNIRQLLSFGVYKFGLILINNIVFGIIKYFTPDVNINDCHQWLSHAVIIFGW